MKSKVENTGSPIDPNMRAASPHLYYQPPSPHSASPYAAGVPANLSNWYYFFFLLFSRRLNIKIPNLTL